MNFKQIKKESYKSIPVLYGFIKQYRRYIDNDNPERVGIDYTEFKAKHFFPYGLNKPISRIVDYSAVPEFNYNEPDQ
jgi:hypothetical protein